MDCGVELKRLYKNPSRKSKHHSRQSKFEGSDRQIRGAVVRFLTQHKTATHQELQTLGFQEDRLAHILEDLCSERFIKLTGNNYSFV